MAVYDHLLHLQAGLCSDMIKYCLTEVALQVGFVISVETSCSFCDDSNLHAITAGERFICRLLEVLLTSSCQTLSL